jgi:pSer/pThr/pTyr-binding forkhead associated (FHA) protein
VREPRVGKCPKCGQSTPLKSGGCLYCGALLDDVRPTGSDEGKILEEPRLRGGQKRFVRQTDDASHYLLFEAGEPYRLDPGKLFVLGRDSRGAYVIHVPDVSRQHAEIDWTGDPPRPILAEVRSRHGTFLNGKLVKKDAHESLRDGDEIRLGSSFTVTYRHSTEHDLREELLDLDRNETRQLKLPGPAPVAAAPAAAAAAPAPAPDNAAAVAAALVAAGFAPPQGAAPMAMPQAAVASRIPESGDLAAFPGAVLLESLHREKRTGTLTVFDGAGSGEIFLVDGRAKKAIFGALSGREALEHVGLANRGAFRFKPEDPAAASFAAAAQAASFAATAQAGAPIDSPRSEAFAAMGQVFAPAQPQFAGQQGFAAYPPGYVPAQPGFAPQAFAPAAPYQPGQPGQQPYPPGQPYPQPVPGGQPHPSGAYPLQPPKQHPSGAYPLQPPAQQHPSGAYRLPNQAPRGPEPAPAGGGWDDAQPPLTPDVLAAIRGTPSPFTPTGHVLPLRMEEPKPAPGGAPRGAPPGTPGGAPRAASASSRLRAEGDPAAAERPPTQQQPPRGAGTGARPRAADGAAAERPPTRQEPPRPSGAAPARPRPSERNPAADRPPTQQQGPTRPSERNPAVDRPPTQQQGPARAPAARPAEKPPGEPALGGPAARAMEALGAVRALGLAGNALGNFVADACVKFLEEGSLDVAVEVGERGLALAEKAGFEHALEARLAFKSRWKGEERLARIVELLQLGPVIHGTKWAAPIAVRVLTLLDPEVPPDPKDTATSLGRIAGIARGPQ